MYCYAEVWDLREGQLFYTLNGHEGAAMCAEFSPSGDYFASVGLYLFESS